MECIEKGNEEEKRKLSCQIDPSICIEVPKTRKDTRSKSETKWRMMMHFNCILCFDIKGFPIKHPDIWWFLMLSDELTFSGWCIGSDKCKTTNNPLLVFPVSVSTFLFHLFFSSLASWWGCWCCYFDVARWWFFLLKTLELNEVLGYKLHGGGVTYGRFKPISNWKLNAGGRSHFNQSGPVSLFRAVDPILITLGL